MNVTKLGVGTAMLAGCALVMVGCSSSGSSPSATAGTTTSAGAGTTSGAGSTGTKTESTSIGTVLADSSGRTIYELVGATSTSSACTGACLSIWPAVTADGKQLVIHSHPAYNYSRDSTVGQTNGQGIKDEWGTWWALDASGNPITSTASAPSSSSSGGGYHY